MGRYEAAAQTDKKVMAGFLIFLYAVFFGFLSVLKYNSFSYSDFDLAVHAQTIYNLLHGSIENSILGVPFLGNHLNLVLFLIAPIYLIFKTPLTLLLLQTLALGLSSYPLYLIAKKELPKKFSLVVLFSYLFYPCLGYVNLFEFHPTVFATLFLSVCLYFMYKGSFGPFFIFVILSLLCQENIPLLIMPLGLYLFITKRPFKWWFFTILAGGAWFWLAAYKLVPYFGKGTIKFIAIYGYLGGSIPEVFKNILNHPIQIFKIIFMKQNLVFLSQIFGPVLFLPLLNPIGLLGTIPTLFQHLLSLRGAEHTIFYHYTAEIIPFVFFAFIFALKRILSVYKKDGFLAACLVITAVGSNIILGPQLNYILNLDRFRMTDLDCIKNDFLKEIPEDAETAATFEFLPKLSNRRRLYSLHHAIMGTYTLSDIPYELPNTTEYAIVDFGDRLTFKATFYNAQSGNRLRRLFGDGSFGIVNMLETVVLFKKGVVSSYYLYKILPCAPGLSDKFSAVANVANEDIELIGYDIDKGEIKNGVIAFKFYWRCLKKTEKSYGAFLDITDKKDRLIKRTQRSICYRIYPTNEWTDGEIIEEYYRMRLPGNLPLDNWQVKTGIFDIYEARYAE